jgi:hypothetical protein
VRGSSTKGPSHAREILSPNTADKNGIDKRTVGIAPAFCSRQTWRLEGQHGWWLLFFPPNYWLYDS